MPASRSSSNLAMLCRDTRVCWALRLHHEQAGWVVSENIKISKTRQQKLLEFLKQQANSSWLSGTLASGRSRSRQISVDGLKCTRLYAFPAVDKGSVLLAGVDGEMSLADQRFWRSAPAQPATESARQPISATDPFLPLLAEFSLQLSQTETLETLFSASSQLLKKLLHTPWLALYSTLFDQKSLQAFRISPDKKSVERDVILKDDFWPLPGEMQSLRYVRATDSGVLPVYGKTQCGILLPLQFCGQVTGLLLVEREQPTGFTEQEEQFLHLAATQIARQVDYLRMIDEARLREQHYQETLEALNETQQELQARIGAHRDAETRLVQAAKLAAVGEMAAGVAHELNNPLTTVVGFTELVLDDLAPDSPIRDDLEMVLREARRARSVVRRLLDFSRQSESTRVRTDINEIVEDVVMLTKHLMHTSGVQVNLNVGRNLPWVFVDRNQIKQVLINLVNNAIYAMPSGGRLGIETEQRSLHGRNWLTLTVRDTGVGIAEGDLQRIFEPFFTTRGDKGGTGLGLSVTYGIVTDHGGRIEVESQVGAGSIFVVWLPLETIEVMP